MEEKNKKNQCLVEPAMAMWNSFFGDLDPSIFEAFARRLPEHRGQVAVPPPWHNLGGGADADVYGRRVAAMNYCVSVPRPDFLERLDRDYRSWGQNLSELSSKARKLLFEKTILTLIPPLHVGTNPEIVIMPMADTTSSCGVQPQLPESAFEQTESLLDECGLILNDVPQIGWWRGVPFIFDWSDLRPAISNLSR